MAFVQRIQPAGACQAGEHGDCHVIDCITTEPVTDNAGSVIHEAGAVVWHSHMGAGIHPEHRLNDSHPAEDHRGGEPVPVTVTPWCGPCMAHPAAPGTLTA